MSLKSRTSISSLCSRAISPINESTTVSLPEGCELTETALTHHDFRCGVRRGPRASSVEAIAGGRSHWTFVEYLSDIEDSSNPDQPGEYSINEIEIIRCSSYPHHIIRSQALSQSQSQAQSQSSRRSSSESTRADISSSSRSYHNHQTYNHHQSMTDTMGSQNSIPKYPHHGPHDNFEGKCEHCERIELLERRSIKLDQTYGDLERIKMELKWVKDERDEGRRQLLKLAMDLDLERKARKRDNDYYKEKGDKEIGIGNGNGNGNVEIKRSRKKVKVSIKDVIHSDDTDCYDKDQVGSDNARDVERGNTVTAQ